MNHPMSRAEFIALIAMMFAAIAFSIDAMLPALPEIGRELSPDAMNNAQLILTSFVLGIGVGTFFTGPLSDAFGRKRVIVAGAALYIIAAAVAYFSTSLEVVLAARVVQGLGAAAPRIVSLAVVRDLYAGREMARIVSIAMMIFTIFPAFAPLMGAGIIALAGWRSIFLAFILFACIFVTWMWLRLPESLAMENRRPFRAHLLWAAVKEMFAHPAVRMSILVQSLCLAILFLMLSLVHPVYEVIFDRAETFPYWFGAIAAVSASGSFVNAALVVRVGMRRMVTWSLGLQVILAGAMVPVGMSNMDGTTLFALFLLWQSYVFFMAGTTMGNLNAIAMEPMGHIAGMAASTISGIATISAAAIAAPIGLTFNGSLFPLTFGIFVLAAIGFGLMLQMGRVERRLTA
ncbi:MFS transporter [Aestuariivita boseongensis]|uniref:MFS transporter n=1 Tax=Aestuariivita boseongensis TaxID=1470562 RepID=UPI000681E3CC|nr:MFS transporter [Aestuariivita boseongensis]